MSWTGSWRYSRSPRASVSWVVGRGGREQRACSPLSSASRLSLTCPPEASPDMIPVTWDPAALPEVNTLITHSKRFRCLYFSSSQICSLANASPHLPPREKNQQTSLTAHQNFATRFLQQRLAQWICWACARVTWLREKKKNAETKTMRSCQKNLLWEFSWLMTNHCISLCHGSCINYHKIRKGFIQLSFESLGKKLKLTRFFFFTGSLQIS